MRLLSTLLALACVSVPRTVLAQRLVSINTTTQGQISYDTPEDATQWGDQQIGRFAINYVEPLTIRFTKNAFQSSSNSDDSTISYSRLRLAGSGTFWQSVTGVQGVWIDLRSKVLASSSYTLADLSAAGVTFINQTSITYDITYINTLSDSYDIIHAHGQTATDWRTDGAAFLSDMPLAPFQSKTYSYTIPWSNAGTYFMHSHWGFNALNGLNAPLVIATDAPAGYKYKQELDDPNLVDAVMFLEDWCLQMTDGDDSENNTNFDPTMHREPYICQNPFLSYRAMWGEWNTDPEKKKKQTAALDARAKNGTSFTCEAATEGFEFGFAYMLANGRQYEDAETRKVNPGDNVRLRIINAGALTTYRVIIPDTLSAQVIAVDGHYILPVSAGPTPGDNTTNTVWIAVGQRVDVFFTIPNPSIASFPIFAVQETPLSSQAAGDSGANQTNVAELSKPGYSGIALYAGEVINMDTTPTLPATPGLLAKNPDIVVTQETSFLAYGGGLGWEMTDPTINWLKLDLNGYNGIRGFNGVGWQTPPTIANYSANPNPFKVVRGQKVCLNITNYDHEIHPIHLHGHTFQVKSISGKSIEGAWRDTVQVPVCSSVIACFNANAASDSVHSLHCHMALHEMSGMQTTITYEKYVGIANTYTGDLNAYAESLVKSASATAPITNNYYGTSSSELTRTGLGVGLALGLALLISWIFFGCAFYRYSQSHHYRPNMTADGRPSISHVGKVPNGGNLTIHQELDEVSQSRQ